MILCVFATLGLLNKIIYKELLNPALKDVALDVPDPVEVLIASYCPDFNELLLVSWEKGNETTSTSFQGAQ